MEIHRKLTEIAIKLGASNFGVQTILRLRCRPAVLRFRPTHIDVCMCDAVVRISPKHFPIAIEIARHFEEYFSVVLPQWVDGESIVDYSGPRLHTYRDTALQFELSSTAEESTAIQEYFRYYRPRPGEVVFDVGAYCGVSTYHLSKCVGPEGKVVAFEPDSTNFPILLRNIERHDLRNVVALNVAMAGRAGTEQFSSEGATSSGIARTLPRASFGVLEPVEAVSLAEACHKHGIPSFVKIDVEGAEIDLISGAMPFLREHAIQFAIDTSHRVVGDIPPSRAVGLMFAQCGYWTESSDKSGLMTTWAAKDKPSNLS